MEVSGMGWWWWPAEKLLGECEGSEVLALGSPESGGGRCWLLDAPTVVRAGMDPKERG